jgi:hypothetical protein
MYEEFFSVLKEVAIIEKIDGLIDLYTAHVIFLTINLIISLYIHQT